MEGGRLAFLGGLSAAGRWDKSYIEEPANPPEGWTQLPSRPAARCLWLLRAAGSCFQAVPLSWRSLRPRGSPSRAHLPCAGPGMEKRAILIRDGLELGSPARNPVSLASQHHAAQSIAVYLALGILPNRSRGGSRDPTGSPEARGSRRTHLVRAALFSPRRTNSIWLTH